MHSRNNDNKYCDYHPVNALLEQFAPAAERHGIRLITDMGLMYSLIDDGLLLQMLSTALEIAVDLCDALPEGREKYIRVRAVFYPRWCIVIDNPCREDLRVDEDGDIPLDENGRRDPRAVRLAEDRAAAGLGGFFNLNHNTYMSVFMDSGSADLVYL